MRRVIITGTLVAGTLDIMSAVATTLINGKASPAQMLQGLASGSFGNWAFSHSTVGPIVGLIVHYAIMSVIVAAFVIAARYRPVLTERPVLAGAAYGLSIYVFMYWIVIPLRWPPENWPPNLRSMSIPIFIHILLVGIPIALVTAKAARRSHV